MSDEGRALDPALAERIRRESLQWEVVRIIESYSLTMVGTDTEPYINACADDVLHVALGWPVTYKVSS